MNSDRFQRAEQLFHQAMSMSTADRRVFIERESAGDRELAAQLERLIRFAECDSATPNAFVPIHLAGTDGNADAACLVGQTIGRYRIIKLIGEGGFGTVYHAEQEHPVRRPFALKVLKSGMDSRQVVARFDAERQALAMMEHPSIARVFDAGQTDPASGSRPYFVMELVTGEPITEFCDRNRLDWRARLELFITICMAVQHAHQKGIIHRDLKPSNILVRDVDGRPTPTVIDFGIAKAVAAGRTPASQSIMTQRMEMLGTPQYMSPEQAEGGQSGIDTRSDIYSLGVILYELLTGTTPLDDQTMQNASYSQLQRLIQDQAAERPSTRLKKQTTSQRETPAAPHQHSARPPDSQIADATLMHPGESLTFRQLRGDLDWITLKALEKDPQRRYAGASELADDVRRHLNHEPVLAGPPSAAYRMRKFIRRHRIGVAAAAIVVLAVVGGSIGTTVAMMRARDSANQAHQVNQFMRDVLTSVDPNAGDGAAVRLTDVLVSASQTASQRFVDHPEMEAQVRDMLAQVYYQLAMWKESAEEFRRTQEILTSLNGPNDRAVLRAQVDRARSLGNLGLVKQAGQVLDDAIPRIERSLPPSDPLWFSVQCALANRRSNEGHPEESEKILRPALQRAVEMGADDRTQLIVQETMVSTLLHLIDSSTEDRERLRVELPELAHDLLARIRRLNGPQSLAAMRDQFLVAHVAFQYGQCSEAADLCRGLLDGSAERLGECHNVRSKARDLLADALRCLGDRPTAADEVLASLQCQRVRTGPVAFLAQLFDAFSFLDYGGRWVEGEQVSREARSMLQTMGGGHGAMLLVADMYIARFVALQGRLDEAGGLFDALLLRSQEAADEQRTAARLEMFYASYLMQRGQLDEAETRLMSAAKTLGDITQGTWYNTPDDLIAEFINLYDKQGKPEKAEHYRELQREAVGAWRLAPHG